VSRCLDRTMPRIGSVEPGSVVMPEVEADQETDVGRHAVRSRLHFEQQTSTWWSPSTVRVGTAVAHRAAPRATCHGVCGYSMMGVVLPAGRVDVIGSARTASKMSREASRDASLTTTGRSFHQLRERRTPATIDRMYPNCCPTRASPWTYRWRLRSRCDRQSSPRPTPVSQSTIRLHRRSCQPPSCP
jgi:hypothetical protein